MLQKLRNSANIAMYTRYVHSLEATSRKITENLYKHLHNFKGTLMLAYHRQGYLPASVAYWFILTMNPEQRVVIHESNTIAYYMLPYHESGLVILYSTNPYAASTYNLLQTARLTGYEVLLVTLTPRDERINTLYSRYSKIYINTRDELEAALIMAISTYYVLGELYKNKLGSRGKRIYEHIEEGLSPIVEELVNRYTEQLERIVKFKEVVITSSRLLEPIALYFAEALRRLGINAYYQFFEHIDSANNILLLSTSAEEHFTRELRFKYNIMDTTLENMVLNTDPLEAQIYLALLAYYLVYSYNRAIKT